MRNKEFITKNTQETQKLAKLFAREVVHKFVTKAVVTGLEGELGAGKTVFVKGFAEALGIKEKISSPTFVLIKSYKIDKSAIRPTLNPRLFAREFSSGCMADWSTDEHKFLVHIDAYRLKDHRDLIPLGIKEIFADPKNIVLIEWSDRVKKILPKGYLKIHFDHIDENTRKISV